MACLCGQKDQDKSLSLLHVFIVVPLGYRMMRHSNTGFPTYSLHRWQPAAQRRQPSQNCRHEVSNSARPKNVEIRANRFSGHFLRHWGHVLCEAKWGLPYLAVSSSGPVATQCPAHHWTPAFFLVKKREQPPATTGTAANEHPLESRKPYPKRCKTHPGKGFDDDKVMERSRHVRLSGIRTAASIPSA